ncbi:MAG TPA: lipid-A-disaccharide synthase [Beijerinckiaceae bacterium]|jgi:lipid-A-disaccharide synthase
MTAEPIRIWLVAGEESGDQLGAKLMSVLEREYGDRTVRFAGVGGPAMLARGLEPLFPMTDINVMGIGAVVAQLPRIVRRVYETVDAVVAAKPDALVIIDSPDFTHQVARRVRRRAPGIPIINYVSPSVWAWRPGRAKAMRAYVDHVLALKPFEPAALLRLGGPPCTYVGHPLVEQIDALRPQAGERPPLAADPLRLLVLPGSRRSEISRLLDPFGGALELLAPRLGRPLEVTVPAVAHLADVIEAKVKAWPVPARVVRGEAAKWAAFRGAHAALAASGTVTLELALSGVPMTVAYKVSALEYALRHLVKVSSIVLANLILDENVIPERIQENCTPEILSRDLLALLADTPERRAQLDAFARLDDLMAVEGGEPSRRAARVLIETIGHRAIPAS